MVEQLVELIFGAGKDQQQLLRVIAMTKAMPHSDHLPLVSRLSGQADRLETAQVAIEAAFTELAKLAKLDDPLRSCLLYTSPSPRDGLLSRMPSSA